MVFPQERGVFIREVNNNYYRISAYYWSKIMTEVPFSIFFPVLQVCIVYWLVGLNNSSPEKPILLVCIMILSYNAFSGLGYILGTMFRNARTVSVLTPLLLVPQMLFAGFFINQNRIPKWLVWLREICIPKYTYQTAI